MPVGCLVVTDQLWQTQLVAYSAYKLTGYKNWASMLLGTIFNIVRYKNILWPKYIPRIWNSYLHNCTRSCVDMLLPS